MLRTFILSALIAIVASAASPAFAGIVTTGPNAPVLTTVVAPYPGSPPGAPLTLNEGNTTYESNTNFFAWHEGQFQVGSAFNVDWTGTGTVSNSAQLGTVSIGPGEVNSYYLRFDQVGTGATGNLITNASITFDEHIIGVMITGARQSTGDATFAPTGLTYGSGAGGAPNVRGLEPNGTGTNDRFSISPDGRTLTIIWSFTGNAGVDTLRVITNPEPGTLALFGLGVLALGGLVRRRRRLGRCAIDRR